MSSGPEQLLGNLLLSSLTTLSENVTDGKSGNFFFYTHDSYQDYFTVRFTFQISNIFTNITTLFRILS
jgi:hypothetical protein